MVRYDMKDHFIVYGMFLILCVFSLMIEVSDYLM